MSDYEYQDYLGGRSFSSKQIDTDEDNVDVDAQDEDDATSIPTAGSTATWADWWHRGKYALEFILKAIETRPQ